MSLERQSKPIAQAAKSSDRSQAGGVVASIRKIVRHALDEAGLSMIYYRALEWRSSLGRRSRITRAPDGLALPPPYLMTLVTGAPDADWFLAQGEVCAKVFANAADRAGLSFGAASKILDLGCGCGRVVRHVRAMTEAELVGMDYNARLIAWCHAYLPGGFVRNGLQPPMPARDGEFDIVYLMSVFTHLGIKSQRAWLAELNRVTRPGGVVLLTFHDEDHSTLPLDPVIRETLAASGYYVANAQGEGSNFTATFQTRAFTQQLLSETFDVLEVIPSHETQLMQALAVLRRRNLTPRAFASVPTH